ncbi:XdhC family protein [Advenella mimigardefordensis]|uniref:Putative carbon monoxide dehydrogenase accessory protein, XdhC/CoxI family n=1 Tax=Advenella mimigardefordensis (strain DSM 17166 / LMG 22922 / DPN7) TaxID=1247726 RepID=W0PIX5_ADVMD|nr:XdhC family protein [Advenella mimigardefordensis]AHG65505.1 putative carbon monoxide dehydrogenase accessory protein, XdhC/CoxI family [Advenella mimigardefordensis DPN7]
MENLDVLVLRRLSAWRAERKKAVLATVTRTWGSSPRPVGSIMALCEDGAVVGSVSGGCIEDDLFYRYTTGDEMAALTDSAAPCLVQYGLTAEEAFRFGLPCGGTLEILLEFNPDPHDLQTLVSALDQGQLMQRTVSIKTGTVQQRPVDAPLPFSFNKTTLSATFGPEFRMLLIGAGQLAEYVATMALFSGFAVTVCDPRIEYRKDWSVQGVTLLPDMPDDVVTTFQADARSCIIALTHDPKLDDLALMEALETKAFYVGAIGSRRNNQARRQRLMEHFGLEPEPLARLRGPIGVYIGSKTPAEIAISVMAEVIAAKNGVALPASVNVAYAKEQTTKQVA